MISDTEIIEALKQCGGSRVKAAESLGVKIRGFQQRLARLKAKGTDVPDPIGEVQGTSTLYGADGSVRLTWVKQKPGIDPEAVSKSIRDALSDIPKPKPVPAPKVTKADLLTVYPIGDQHVGMYSWAEETGADYDLKIAESLLTAAMRHLVTLAPPSEEAVIVDVGDFTHYDTIRNETVRSHNALDADSRYHAMIRVALRLLVSCVDSALTKHKRVTLICAPGNHNDMGAAWMIESLALYYCREPRVRVMAKAGKFFFYEFGNVLLGVTHGDTGKPEKLAGVMAADQRQAWGRTEHHHWLTGHVHNKTLIEMQGVTWETFRTLAPGDAWSSAAAYRAGREMNAIVYHKQHGEYGRHTFNASMLEAA